jgi:hypothetical protein
MSSVTSAVITSAFCTAVFCRQPLLPSWRTRLARPGQANGAGMWARLPIYLPCIESTKNSSAVPSPWRQRDSASSSRFMRLAERNFADAA